MLRLFTIPVDISFYLLSNLPATVTWVPNPVDADYLVLPFKYEIIYDFAQQELDKEGIDAAKLARCREVAAILDNLSATLHIPLIVTFYRDPRIPLLFKNAYLFRTSMYAAEKQNQEWGLPAFVDHFPGNTAVEPMEKPVKPFISFRGEAAPLVLSSGMRIKQLINKAASATGSKPFFRYGYNEGYLLRRQAMLSVLKQKTAFNIDFVVNPVRTHPHDHKAAYLNSFLHSCYFICAAGHGNYSYRLYETLREGRIPVFINTDCVLPCADVIDWKNQMVWVEANEVAFTAKKVLEFHQKHSNERFVQLQETNKRMYETYLTEKGFSRYLFTQFLAKRKREKGI